MSNNSKNEIRKNLKHNFLKLLFKICDIKVKSVWIDTLIYKKIRIVEALVTINIT